MCEEQAGFRKEGNRLTIQQNFNVDNKARSREDEKTGKKAYHCFIDFQKAFDFTKQDVTWAVYKSYGVGKRLIDQRNDEEHRPNYATKHNRQ